MKKFYKDFKKVYIGTSDIASLTVRSVRNVYDLHFGIDGGYNAYECFGDVEIGGHYSKVFSGKSWLKIFDDSELVYSKHFDEFPFFDIYRAGNYGCIIHWHGEEAEKATIEDFKMEKLKSYIETWINGKSVKGIRVTPVDIYDCIDAYNALVKKEKFEFISENVKAILDKCGISTKEKGIGWIAFI